MLSWERLHNPANPHPAVVPVIALALNLLLFALFLGVASPSYETNDDALMMSIASGGLTGEPSEYLIFTNVLVGRLLKRLYGLSANVNWYSISLYLAHLAAMTTLLAIWLKRRFGTASLFCFLLLFVGIEVRLLLQVQFTSTAFLIATSGILLLASAELRSRWGLSVALFGIVQIVWGAMLREQAVYLAAAVSSPLWISELFRRRAVRNAGALAVAAVLAAALTQYDHHVYRRHPEWSAFREFNLLRGRIHGSPLLTYDTRSAPVLDQLGWSPNDVGMFQTWFFSDDQLFSTAALRRIVDEFSDRTRPDWPAYLSGRLAAVDVYLWLTVFSVLAAFWLAGPDWKRLLGVGLVTFGLSGAMLVYLSLYRWVPDRVLTSLMMYGNVLVFYLALNAERKDAGSQTDGRSPLPVTDRPDGQQPDDTGRPRRFAGIAFAAIVLGCAASVWLVTERHLAINQGNRINHNALEYFVDRLWDDYVERGNGALFVSWGGPLPNEWAPVFSHNPKLARLPIIRIGWSVRSPHFQSLLAKHGISNLCKSLYERADVYLLCTQRECARLQAFVREHFATRIACRIDARYNYEHETTAGPRELTVRKAIESDK